jgi:hypothetical protein
MALCAVCYAEADVWPPRPEPSESRLTEGERCNRCDRTAEEELVALEQEGARGE